jgi:dienelactone hydrolase
VPVPGKTAFFLFVLVFLLSLGCAGSAQSGNSAKNENSMYTEVTGAVKNGSREVPFTALIPNGKGPFPLVVMNHGHGGSRDEGGGFKRLAEAIAEKGIAVIRMDFPGCGESSSPFTQNTMTSMISDSECCLTYMLKQYPVDKNRLGLLGYSMGGRVALETLKRPDNSYKVLVLLAPAVAPGDNLIKLLAGQSLPLSDDWYTDLRNSRPLENVRFSGPVLLILGEKDRVITKAECDAAQLALEKAGSLVTRILVPGSDHGYGFFGDRGEVSTIVEGGVAGFFAEKL